MICVLFPFACGKIFPCLPDQQEKQSDQQDQHAAAAEDIGDHGNDRAGDHSAVIFRKTGRNAFVGVILKDQCGIKI